MKAKLYSLTISLLLLFSPSSYVYGQYGLIGNRTINGVEYQLYNFNYEELFAYATGYTSSVPENLTIPATIMLSEDSKYDGKYLVVEVSSKAFEGCSKLKTVTIVKSSVASEAFKNCQNLTAVNWESVRSGEYSVGQAAFMGCTNLKSIILPSDLYFIDSSAFQDCSSIEDFALPNITYIGEKAFAGCSSLHEITFPASLTEIRDQAFKDCLGLTSIIIPSTIKEINGRAFHDCKCIQHVYIEDSNDELALGLFYGNGDAPYLAFEGCNHITSLYVGRRFVFPNSYATFRTVREIVFGNYINRIESRSLENFVNLQSVKFMGEVEEIGDEAFHNCNSLQTLILPESLNHIGSYAFWDCSNLKSITLPEAISYMGDYAFNGCRSLEDVYCYAITLPSTGYRLFYETSVSNATLYVPSAALSAYKTSEPWKQFGKIIALTEVGLDSVLSSEVHRPSKIYTPDGKSFSITQRGMNILRMNDGTTMKVLKK